MAATPLSLTDAQRRRLGSTSTSSNKRADRQIWIAIEIGVANILALLAGNWLSPQDPFGLTASFPWLWLVPLLLALRYGTVGGVSSVVLLVGAWLASRQWIGSESVFADFPSAYFVGGLALNLIAGQFADVWNTRIRRMNSVNAYIEERLGRITKNHFLLRLSHQRLEQDLLVKPLTLREALLRLRQLSIPSSGSQPTALPAAAEFMQLLAQSCQLEVAGIFSLQAGQPQQRAVAVLGDSADLQLDDPLLQYCLEQEALAHIQTGAAFDEARNSSRYLVCVPVKPTGSACMAVVVVERMPFFALNNEVLQLLTVLTGYYADGLQMQAVAREVLRRVPGCPPEMAVEIIRLHRIHTQAGIASSLVALVFDAQTMARDMFDHVRLRRSVDLAWEVSFGRRHVLITLLPLAGPAAVEGYLLRVGDMLQSQFGKGLQESHVVTHTATVGIEAPGQTLMDLVRRCGG